MTETVTKEHRAVAMRVADALLGIELDEHDCGMLEVSTAMIPLKTVEMLNTGDFINRTVAKWGDYGWILWTGDISLPNHPELTKLLRFANERGYLYLKLDCDAPPLPAQCGLPTFSW